MWIRSQSLLTLANFERLNIRQYGSKEFGIVCDRDIILGKYSTMKKALIVLDEIQMAINNKQLCVIDKAPRGSYVLNKGVQVYQMPKDEDVEV